MSAEKDIRLTLNGNETRLRVGLDERLSAALRRAGLKGVKEGCDEGMCGACTVILDGRAVNACLLYAWQAHGRTVETIESLGTFEAPHPLQAALADAGGVQCGYCTPGLILSVVAALRANPALTEAELIERMDGNLCRCTGYEKIQEAIRAFRAQAPSTKTR